MTQHFPTMRNLTALLGSTGLCLLAAIACDGEGATIIGNNGGNAGQTGNVGGSDNTAQGGDGGSAPEGGSSGSENTATGGTSPGGAAGNGAGGTDPVLTDCPDHPNVTAREDRCEISSSLAAPITEDLTLDAANVWLMTGPVIIGDDSAETVLTVEAGTTVFGNALSFILIQRGSKIIADGEPTAPIVFTSSRPVGERGPLDWGGLVINGRAPINRPDATEGDPGSQAGEAQTGRFGGNVPADDSGTLNYVRVEFAGRNIDPENELNGIAFQGVGSETDVDFVQVHMVQDDGIEFFGGTVNVKHVVVTGANDDSVDWTEGWVGKAQFIIAEELNSSSNLSADPRGIEADNIQSTTFIEAPFSDPILSNITLIGRAGAGGNTQNGMRLRRGTKGEIWNSIVYGWGACLEISETPTVDNVNDGSLLLKNVVFNCGGAAPVGGAAASVFLDAGNALVAGIDPVNDPANVLVLTDPVLPAPAVPAVATDPCLRGILGCWLPAAGSPAIGIGANTPDLFFDQVTYAGAFNATDDWTAGWIQTANN